MTSTVIVVQLSGGTVLMLVVAIVVSIIFIDLSWTGLLYVAVAKELPSMCSSGGRVPLDSRMCQRSSVH
jgi:hypothetical protein